jgi:hypothetical protein
MPFPGQLVLGASAIVCAVMAAIYSDRMAKDLRGTGEARYANPWVIPGRRLYRRSDLHDNYRERFPQSSLPSKTRFFTFFAVILFLATCWTLPRQQHVTTQQEIDQINLQANQ